MPLEIDEYTNHGNALAAAMGYYQGPYTINGVEYGPNGPVSGGSTSTGGTGSGTIPPPGGGSTTTTPPPTPQHYTEGGPLPHQYATYIPNSGIETGYDAAGSYLNWLAADPNNVVSTLSPYIDRETGTISIQDINNALHTVQDWTGSGRQGSGRYNLGDLYFDEQGNPLVANNTTSIDPNTGEIVTNRGYTSSTSLQDLASRDSGVQWWRPEETDQSLTNYFTQQVLPEGVRNWSTLNPREQQRLISQGIFNFDDSRAQFISTDPSDPQYNQYWNGIDMSSGRISAEQLNDVLRGGLARQFDALGNTTQASTESYLTNNPQLLLQALGYAIPGLQPFAALAGGTMNVGQGIANENWTQAALGGIGLYNTAANIANTGGTTYNLGVDRPGQTWYNETYGVGNTIPDSGFYTPYGIGETVGSLTNNTLPDWANRAIETGGIAALTGGDPLYYAGGSLVNSAGQGLMDYLGIDPDSPWAGLFNQGLGYLYGNAYNNWQYDGGGSGGGGSGTGGGGSGGGGGTTTPITPTMPIPPGQQYQPPSINYTPPSPYGNIPGGSGGSGGYGSGPTYGTGETYEGDSAQDPGNPYNWSKPETVYG